MASVPQALVTTATVIGFVVMFAWVVLSVWLISIVIGEFRFNRILKRRAEREYEVLRSSRIEQQREPQFASTGGSDWYETAEFEFPINFQFHPDEDEFPTEETGAVFDINERFPNEFA